MGKTPFTAILNLRRFRRDFGPNSEGRPSPQNARERSDVLIDLPGAVGVGRLLAADQPAHVLRRLHAHLLVGGSHPQLLPAAGRRPADGPPPPPIEFRELPYPTLDDTDQTDTEQIRLGLEVVAIVGRVRVPIRGGLFWDRQYFRAESSTGSPPRFEGYTFGTGISVGPMLLDIAYLSERGRFLAADEQILVSTRFSRIFASIIYRHGQ